MGCSSCSTTSDGTVPGCKSHGTCGTGGCNKLNVYNWLSDMALPEGFRPFDIVEVRFKGSRKDFFRNAENVELKTGDVVAVEGNPGHDIGTVSLTGELVRFQLKRKGISEAKDLIKTLYRHARPADLEKWEAVKALEVETMYKARSIALKLSLKMKLSDVEYQGDGKKATFYYTADERVDFRELIKKLAEEFRVRVEMRQIGMRQEASRLGGIGSCGRELCCSTWLTDFKIVSTSAARYQNLSLNPIKLAGQCGKLKCCLNYELDSYMDAISDIPEANTKLATLKGNAVHKKTDIFKRLMWFAYVEESPDSEMVNSDNWIVIPVDRVKDILQMNRNGEKPADLSDYSETVVIEKPMDYADVVGQDSLTRMMDKKKKKKKKKGHQKEQASNNPQQVASRQPAPNRQQPNSGKGGQPNKQQQPQQQQQNKKNQEQGRNPQRNQPRPPGQQMQRPPRQQSGERSNQENKPKEQQPQQPQQPQQDAARQGRQLPPRTAPPK